MSLPPAAMTPCASTPTRTSCPPRRTRPGSCSLPGIRPRGGRSRRWRCGSARCCGISSGNAVTAGSWSVSRHGIDSKRPASGTDPGARRPRADLAGHAALPRRGGAISTPCSMWISATSFPSLSGRRISTAATRTLRPLRRSCAHRRKWPPGCATLSGRLRASTRLSTIRFHSARSTATGKSRMFPCSIFWSRTSGCRIRKPATGTNASATTSRSSIRWDSRTSSRTAIASTTAARRGTMPPSSPKSTSVAAWSRASKKPLITTECWAVVDYKDWPGLDWGWVKDLTARGVAHAASQGRWVAIATSNFCGPQFVGMWRDIAWHRRLTDLIKSSPIDPDLRA